MDIKCEHKKGKMCTFFGNEDQDKCEAIPKDDNFVGGVGCSIILDKDFDKNMSEEYFEDSDPESLNGVE